MNGLLRTQKTSAGASWRQPVQGAGPSHRGVQAIHRGRAAGHTRGRPGLEGAEELAFPEGLLRWPLVLACAEVSSRNLEPWQGWPGHRLRVWVALRLASYLSLLWVLPAAREASPLRLGGLRIPAHTHPRGLSFPQPISPPTPLPQPTSESDRQARETGSAGAPSSSDPRPEAGGSGRRGVLDPPRWLLRTWPGVPTWVSQHLRAVSVLTLGLAHHGVGRGPSEQMERQRLQGLSSLEALACLRGRRGVAATLSLAGPPGGVLAREAKDRSKGGSDRGAGGT